MQLLKSVFLRFVVSGGFLRLRRTDLYLSQLQEKKRELTRAALSGDKIKNLRLGMNELLALFRPGGHDEDDD